MIVATAGHVDHGKTALVAALTGIDTDRLTEEKRRGLSIDLGFAYQPLATGGVLGFVDVPGHERFIRTMLAGVAAIDRALLVIAADEGPMPQTLEHLAILELLGIEGGAVALTKIDRVDDGRETAVRGAIEALLADGPLARAPVFPISSLRGEGVGALRAWLEAEASRLSAREPTGNFRLAIDRCFTLEGAGLVVTGAVFSGQAGIGETLTLSPSGAPARVRGIHANGREAGVARAGERCALNIAGRGLDKSDIRRGDWLLAEAVHAPTTRLDASVRLLDGERRALRSRTPVHLHLAAADVTARVHPLENDAIAPGGTGLVQLVTDRPIGALYADRFVLRDISARRTIGGGRVLDPFAPARGRAKRSRLAALACLEAAEPAPALAGLLDRLPAGVDLARFATARNLARGEAETVERQVDMVRIDRGASVFGLSPAHAHALRVEIVAALKHAHEERPERAGIEAGRLRALLGRRTPVPVVEGIVEGLVEEGAVRRHGARLALPGFSPAMQASDEALWRRVEPLLSSGGAAPVVHELAAPLGMAPAALRRFLQRAEGLGFVVRVSENRYLLSERVRGLGALVEQLAAEAADGRFSVATYRDRAGIGRNLAIELLEYFDRTGLTMRDASARRLLGGGGAPPRLPAA